MGKPMRVRSVLSDFVVGGALVAGALLLAGLVSPAAGGVLAGAPIRTCAVVSLHYFHNRNLGATVEMARGVLIAMISNVFFALTLYLALPRLGFGWGFVAAVFVFACAVATFERLSAILR
jgi:hypothetical protein